MPQREDGLLDWPAVDSWRKRYVGEEPVAPAAARAAAKRESILRIPQDDSSSPRAALEEARQEGRWAVLQSLNGPLATKRMITVLLALGLSRKHTFFCAYWHYMGAVVYADDITELDTDDGGRIEEPDWKTLLPAGKRQPDFEAAAESLDLVFAELLDPENVVWPDDKRPSIRSMIPKRL
jgi:hypothetical protein